MTSDTELFERYTQTRDDAAFGEIVRRHGAMVFRTAARILGDHTHAEDVAQAVFFLLVERASALEAATPIAAWLHAAARRTALAMRRHDHRRAMREMSFMKRKSPDDRQIDERATAVERLDDALAELPETLRQAVLLRHLEGYSQVEAARIAGCPQGTLAWRTSEGMAELRRKLASSHGASAIVDLDDLLRSESEKPLPDGFVDRLFARMNDVPRGIPGTPAAAMHRVRLIAHPWALTILVTLAAVLLGLVVWSRLFPHGGGSRADSDLIAAGDDRPFVVPCENFFSTLAIDDIDNLALGVHAQKVLRAMRPHAEFSRLSAGSSLFAIADGIVSYRALMTDPDGETPWTLVVLECAVKDGDRSREIVCSSYLFSGRADPAIAPGNAVRRGDRLGSIEPAKPGATDGRLVLTIDPGPYRRMSRSLQSRVRSEAVEIARDAGFGDIAPDRLVVRDIGDDAALVEWDGRTLLNVSLLRTFSGEPPLPPPLMDAWFDRDATPPVVKPSERLRSRVKK